MDAALYPRTDMDGCADEPIRTPSSIQPHGMTLVVEAATGLVRHGAGALERTFGAAWQDAPLPSLLGEAVARRIVALVAPAAGPEPPRMPGGMAVPPGGYVGSVGPPEIAAPGRLDVSAHAADAWIIVDLEDTGGDARLPAFVFDGLEEACAGFESAVSLAALCDAAAAAFGSLTGFDRVMIYRLGEGAGLVLAECLQPASDAGMPQLPSFLHHHFPASDIPSQARALYLRNTIRVIPDVRYKAAGLRPAWPDVVPLDMSDCSLRSVSPVHLQYLVNMGVSASFSVSIVRDGALWGLVACHHRTPRSLSYNDRAACRLLVGSLGRQISVQQQASLLRERLRLRAFEDEIVTALSREGVFEAGLSRQIAETGRMMYGDGAAVVHGDTLVTSGDCPSEPDIRALAVWLLQQDGQTAHAAGLGPVFSTDNLASLYPPADGFKAVCCGLMSVVLSTDPTWLLMWFRAGQVQTVIWAGNPHKDTAHDPALALRPRASFEAWRQTVHGVARPWSNLKRDAAAHLRTALLNAQRMVRERDLNRHLARVLRDKDVLLQQNEFLVGEVNHRVQNSLQLVASFLSLRSRSSTNTELNEALSEARRRLHAVALVHRRLYRGDQFQKVDAARYIEELCADTVAFMGEQWEHQLVLKLTPASISTDRAVNLGLVLTELMINCNKHAYGGAAGPIEIALIEEGRELRLVVADRGVGHSFTDTTDTTGATGATGAGATARVSSEAAVERGYGSRIVAGLVRQLGATISHSDNQPGLRTCITMKMNDNA